MLILVNKRNLGDLTVVALRDVWKDEARDFTPWLADRPDLLGKALGLDLELIGAENAVGAFSADLLFQVVGTERKLVVENMLAATDHDHLGKLMTYAAGLDANYAVLVSERLRPEHLAALEWLNEVSTDEIGFFGIEVEVWQIGESSPAPRLNVIAKPNQWSRTVKVAAGESKLSPLQIQYRKWWTEFLPIFKDAYPDWTNTQAAQAQSWMTFPAGRSAFFYALAFVWPGGPETKSLRAELYIGPKSADYAIRIFDFLSEQKDEIEKDFGGTLSWEALEGRKACRVAIYFSDSATVDQEERWIEYRDWGVKSLGRLRDALQPHLELAPPE